MANYQVLFSGDVAADASIDTVRDNLARELGLDERKAKQLFSGRTVVIRSQLEHQEALDWQERLARFGAICRIKDLTPKKEPVMFDAQKRDEAAIDQTLRDITAAHLECPRCGHLQLDSTFCARCGVDLEDAFKQKRKEDLLIEKKIRELRSKREQHQPRASVAPIQTETRPVQAASGGGKKGVLSWFKK
jgi:ribosomal protein L32